MIQVLFKGGDVVMVKAAERLCVYMLSYHEALAPELSRNVCRRGPPQPCCVALAALLSGLHHCASIQERKPMPHMLKAHICIGRLLQETVSCIYC